MFHSEMQYNQISDASRIHIIGIGGIGISALARMLVADGKEVSGVNDSESPQTLDGLRSQGVPITLDRSIASLPKADVYIYSTAWDINEKEYMDAVRRTGKPVLNYFEALGQTLKGKHVVGIAGTNGKTTTTALIAHGLLVSGRDPSVIVGSLMTLPDGSTSNYRKGRENEPYIVESCEYQRHFLELSPTVLIITNIEEDHLDYYKDIDDIVDAFRELAEKVPPHGAIIYNGNDHNVKRVVQGITAPLIDWTEYELQVDLKVPGHHNRANAQAALATLVHLGISQDKAEEALSTFRGTWRRSEYVRTTERGAEVYDDYAHHPIAVVGTIKGFKDRFPGKKINVIFQPHLFSRTKTLFDEFSKAFAEADNAYILPIYPAREEFDGTVSSEMLVDRAFKHMPNISFISTHEEARDLIEHGSHDDVWITMGAGDITSIGRN